MNLSSLLLSIIGRLDGERTIYAGLHLLRGKKSGQTLQDVEYYHLKDFFAILPKLSTEIFDEATELLLNSGLILMDESSLVQLTKSGKEAFKNLPVYHFNGWDYRGRETIFFARLSLVVQTVSNFRVASKNFLPMQRDAEVQLFVKRLLHNQPINERSFSRNLRDELIALMNKSGLQEIQKTILTHRLVGYDLAGWTWAQLAVELKESPMSLKLYFIESLHLLLQIIETSDEVPFIKEIVVNIKVDTHLTESSMRTKILFDQGYSMHEIASTRQLKMSTIEDHFVEMAINDKLFPVEKFVSGEACESVYVRSEELKTKRLRLLKDAFPELSYFQLRLILSVTSKGARRWTSNLY